MAEEQYPERQDLQVQFAIGFLLAQLASAMQYDSAVYTRFRQRVSELGYRVPKNRS